MKKTVASLAILASASSAFALIGPGGPGQPRPRNYCVSSYHGQNGEAYVGDCDLTQQNLRRQAPLLQNGCAQNQASLRSVRVRLAACPTFVQL